MKWHTKATTFKIFLEDDLQLMKDELDCYNRGIDTSLLLHTLDGTPLLQDLQIMLAQVCEFGKTLSSFKMVYK